MTKQLSIFVIVGALLVFLGASSHATMVAVDDSDLAAISGKQVNQSTFSGSSNLVQGNDNSNGDISIGYYQWNDTHSTDASNHKGANDQSGSTTQVQQSVVGSINAITWGAFAAASYVSGSVTDSGVDQESWGVLFIGGF